MPDGLLLVLPGRTQVEGSPELDRRSVNVARIFGTGNFQIACRSRIKPFIFDLIIF